MRLNFFQLLDCQRTPPSLPSLAAFEVWPEPSDPSIPAHSPPDSWKTNLEIYGLFWSAAGQPAGDPGSSFDLVRNVWNVNVGNLKPSTFKTQKIGFKEKRVHFHAKQPRQECSEHRLQDFFYEKIFDPETLPQVWDWDDLARNVWKATAPINCCMISFAVEKIMVFIFHPISTCTAQ